MKKIIGVLLLLVMVISICPKLNASAESLYIQKFVSVVYDDSGSVHQNGSKNWAYANYAMQSFCGLLNNQDKLFITYLSAPDKPIEIDLASNRQNVVDSIRNHSETNDTPFAAIDNAYNVFGSMPNNNKSTQYWLVIITDGAFIKSAETETTDEVLMSQEDLNIKLDDMADKKMPNGSTVRIMYLAVGQEVISPDPQNVKNLFLYPEFGSGAIISGETIVSVMSKIADKVAGKTRLKQDQITYLDDKTVQIESKIKLVNIAVLSQKSSAKLLNAKITEGKELNLEQSIFVKYPEVSGRTTDETLNGTVSLVSNSGENIEAGKYILTFSEPVNTGSLDILFEPALEIQMKLFYSNGQEVTNVDALSPGETIDAIYKVFETGTNIEVNLDEMATFIQYDLSYFEDGVRIKNNTKADRSMCGINLKQADTKILSSLTIEGFEPIINSVEFNPRKPVSYSIVYKELADNTIVRRELYNNKKAVQFEVLADGIKMTKAELANMDIKYTTDKYKILLAVDTMILDDGTVSCAPRFKCWSFPTKGFWNWSSTWLFSCKEIKIFAEISGKESEIGKVQIVSESIVLISTNYAVLMLMLFFFYGYIFKKRFKINSKICYSTFQNKNQLFMASAADWKVVKLDTTSKWMLIPWFSNRIKINGVTFYAVAKGAVGIQPKDLNGKMWRLNEDMTNENKAIVIPVIALGNPLFSANKSERKKLPKQVLFSGQGLLVTSDMETGIIYKFMSQ